MTETIAPIPTDPTRTRHHCRSGVPLLPPALAYAALTAVATVVPTLIAGVRPWSSDTDLLSFFRNHGGAAHLSAFLTLAAAVPLAVFTAVATARLRALGVDVAGRVIAQLGGAIAAAMLAVAGVATLAATRDHVAESASAVRALNGITFAAGGTAFVVFSGLLVAGVSISGLAFGVLPRPLGWLGIALAAGCEIASLTAAFDALSFLLPVGRFGTLAWMLAVAVTLPGAQRNQDDAARQ